MSGANACQDSNSKVIETTFQPAFIMETSEKKNTLRILHVDDDLCFLEVSKQILSMENNFEIDNVASVDDAFKKMEQQTYDAVVSDYEMPQKNGLEFLQKLRDKNNQIPFILFTGKGREEVAVKALNFGADRYLSKNGSPETVYCELADAINKTVSRKKTEEIVRKSEQRYRELANSLPETVFETDLTGKITFLSQRAFEIIGLTREDLEKGLNMLSFVVPEEREKAKENLRKAFSGEKRGDNEYKLCKKNGTTLPVLVRTNPIISENKLTGLRGLVIDITERKKAEEIVRKSEERYRELANSVPEMVFESDLTGKITYISQRAIDFTGFTNEELEGRNMLDFLVPEDRKRAIENMKRSFIGENLGSSEYSLFRKDGTTYTTLVRTSRIISENKVTGLRGLVIEITELKKSQESLNRTMNELVSVNEKLGVVGSLTRHDVRNKLSAITGYTYLLKKKHKDQADIVESLGKIEQAVADSVKIFEFAKMYEQLGVEELSFVDVGKAVDEAAELFSGLTIKVVNECHGRSVLADSFLRQMFYNFMDNTRKYGVKATTIKVYCEQEVSGGMRLIYEDDGVGISTENKSRLFKKGFSTGGSTGFGLFLIKKMIEVYGWTITEEGEPNKEAKFVITIPKKNGNGNINYTI